MKIDNIKLRVVFDSKGSETIECSVVVDGFIGKASSPSGTSVGEHEAVAFPKKAGLLVDQANTLLVPKLIGNDVDNQASIDDLLHSVDGTDNFSFLGGSVAVAISTACLKVRALNEGKEVFELLNAHASKVPVPLGNVFGAGRHASGGGIQEILLIPRENSVHENLSKNIEVYKEVGRVLHKKNLFAAHGLEGGWAADLSSLTALKLVRHITDQNNVGLGVDIAASEFYNKSDETYSFEGKSYDKDSWFDFVVSLVEDYSLEFVEDPFHENDFVSFGKLTKKVGNKVLVCGDDLFVSNKSRLEQAGDNKTNCALIKPNQVGTVSDVLQTASFAKSNNYELVVSHRSGDTCDSFIAQLSVGIDAKLLKSGIVGGERVSKLNELMRIEEFLNTK